MIRNFTTNEELFNAIREIEATFLDIGNEDAAREIAYGFSCINGLTDGWALMMDSVSKVKEKYSDELKADQKGLLEDVHRCLRKAVYRE